MERIQWLLPSLLFIAVLAMGLTRTRSGDPISWTTSASPKAVWEQIGTASDVITKVNASPAVTARDYSAFWTDLPDANKLTLDVPNEAFYADFRFRTSADADAHVVEIWVAPGDKTRDGLEESFELAAILTLTGGTQTAPESLVFVDTITAVSYTLDGDVVNSAGNRMAVWQGVDLRSYKKIIMVATTFQTGKTLVCDARFYGK